METQIAKRPTEVTFVLPSIEDVGLLKDMVPDFDLTLKYKKADDWAKLEGVPILAYYVGATEITNDDGEMVACAGFMSEQECFISGSMLLVEAVRKLRPNTPVVITYKGKKTNKTSKGATMMFDVKTLKLAPKDGR